jgi:SAM-dependent methyltransferase
MSGSGPGAITADGCAVELYARLPDLGDSAVVASALRVGDTVLDLGCGTGRLARPLVAAGHAVVGVDQSAEMLAHLAEIETVCAPIVDLDLGRAFDAVLLASHLLSVPDDREVADLLAAARRHLRPGGALIAQWHAPEWFDTVRSGAGGELGPVSVVLEEVARDGDLLSATVRYRLEQDEWTQSFVARRRDADALCAALADAGFGFGRWLTGDRSWWVASAQ